METRSGRQFRFVLPGPRLAAGEWQACLHAIDQRISAGALVCASGSLPPGIPEDVLARLSRRVRAGGGRLVLDASGPALRAALEAGAFLIKPNLAELRDLTGEALDGEAAQVAAGRRLIARRAARLVALTLGAEGALLIAADGAWRARPLPITALSTIGAGDSFLGAMVLSLARGASAVEAFRQGAAAGAAALLAPGTELCRCEDVARLSSQVVIEHLDSGRAGGSMA